MPHPPLTLSPAQKAVADKMRAARKAAQANTFLEGIKHSLATKGIFLPDDLTPYEENPDKLKEVLNAKDFAVVSGYLKIWNEHLKPLYEQHQKREKIRIVEDLFSQRKIAKESSS